MDDEQGSANGVPTARPPLIFVSHDTRDAALAEAFSHLLGSVSAGVLKSFRSSDKKGAQGIEYGIEWYPEIMSKLEAASDVVCLLTPHSVGRPWILYEAGVAKGKLQTPVHGVALGIPLQNAATGPFAQFQNSDDSEDALTQLVMQLVRRIPGAEPDREVVKAQVLLFKAKVAALEDMGESEAADAGEEDGASVARIFEEVKVMFQDLPSRIERRLDPEGALPAVRHRRYRTEMMRDLHGRGETPEDVAFLMAVSLVREDFPWLYDLALDVFRKLPTRKSNAIAAIDKFARVFEDTVRHPAFRGMMYRAKDRFGGSDDVEFLVMDALGRMRARLRAKSPYYDEPKPHS